MPTEPVVEPLPASWEPIERQMVDLFFDRVPFGLAVFDLDGQLQRCNRTWTGFYEFYFGAGPEYTAPGRHINDLIPGNEAAIEELFGAVRAGQVVRQAAQRIEIPGVTTYWDVVFAPLFDHGELVGVLDVVTDATDRVRSTERLEARIRAFTHVAAGMTVDQPLLATLEQIRGEVLRTTTASACSIVVWHGSTSGAPQLSTVPDPAFGPGYAEAFHAMYVAAGVDQRTADDVEPFTFWRGARTDALSDPRFAPIHPFLLRALPEWEDAVLLPLVSGREFFGELQVHLPAGSRFGDDDADYLLAMADHAALAIQNAALFREQREAAGTAERQRLARELHDSVSQALFSMTMHVRTAERRLEPLGAEADPARAEVARLHELTKGALAEMRALIFELRPGALAEEGLGAALSKQAAAIAAREQVVIEVVAPPHQLPLSTDAEEHLYRIALEAMHNAVKHARPRRIDVAISFDDAAAQAILVVADDGAGFDTSVEHPGHLGLGTMRERATGLGGTVSFESSPGAGTRVTVVVPVDVPVEMRSPAGLSDRTVIRPAPTSSGREPCRPLITGRPAPLTDVGTPCRTAPFEVPNGRELQMSTTQWILSLALLGWALVRNLGTRQVTRGTFVLPLLIVVVAASFFLFPLPTAGNDLELVVVCGIVGVLFGMAASAVTRLHDRDGRLVATAGAGFAALWLVMIGGRIAFAEWANGAGSRAVGMFSRDHAISGADAWTAGFVVMALGMVLARTVALAVRSHRARAVLLPATA